MLVGHGGPDFPDGEGFVGQLVQDILDGAEGEHDTHAAVLTEGPAEVLATVPEGV